VREPNTEGWVVVRRKPNWLLWLGFGVALVAALSYIPFFSRFPSTRDVPWANLLLFAGAGCLCGIGLYRAFAQSTRYRGKIAGTILTLACLSLFALFSWGIYEARDLPSGDTALRAGQAAPDFTLKDADGIPVTLSGLRKGKRAVLLIFYRGYW
jgi:hypothetical protein